MHTNNSPASRRQFLGRSAAAAAALALGPAFVSACGSANRPSVSSSAVADDGSPATGLLRASNWPLYIADGFVAEFQKTSGLTVDYKEDYNDDEAWFAKNKEPLSRKQDIGCDLVIQSETIAARLIRLGWLAEINESRWPNKKNLQPAILNSSVDPGRKYTAPYMSGMVGLAYNRETRAELYVRRFLRGEHHESVRLAEDVLPSDSLTGNASSPARSGRWQLRSRQVHMAGRISFLPRSGRNEMRGCAGDSHHPPSRVRRQRHTSRWRAASCTHGRRFVGVSIADRPTRPWFTRGCPVRSAPRSAR